MDEINISIEYDTLYFEDLIYPLISLKNSTRSFFKKDEYWLNENIYDYLHNEGFELTKEEYYKNAHKFKELVSKSLTFEISELKPGSIRLKVVFAISETALIPILSSINLPVGITIATILGIVHIIYSENEAKYDEMINNLKRNWDRESISKEKRKIKYGLKSKKENK